MSPRLIKKYPNRRLYDTTSRSYITLDDVKQLVYQHIDFQVIDARTNKDLTQSTLLQIISEQESAGTPIFTSAILQNLIRFYQEKSQDVFSQYLQQTMQVFLQQRNFFQKQLLAYNKLFIDPLSFQSAFTQQHGGPEKGVKTVPKMTKKTLKNKNKNIN